MAAIFKMAASLKGFCLIIQVMNSIESKYGGNGVAGEFAVTKNKIPFTSIGTAHSKRKWKQITIRWSSDSSCAIGSYQQTSAI